MYSAIKDIEGLITKIDELKSKQPWLFNEDGSLKTFEQLATE